MVLDDKFSTRLIDMAGTDIDDKERMVLGDSRNFLPRNTREVPCGVIADLFALGSIFYETITRRQPYADEVGHGVEARYA